MEEYGEVLQNINLKDFNTYKIGGKAKYIIKPFNVKKLVELLDYLKNNNIKYFILGKGSNVIMPDEDYEGVIILLEKLNNISIKDNIVEVESGTLLNKLIMATIDNNLCGIENLYGIPGTVGGAVIQNAGCLGTTFSENLVSVTYLENSELHILNKDECNFIYRGSIFKKDKNKIIISCVLKLSKGNKDEMMKNIREHLIKRNASQPLEYPNAGSVFRNPINNYAGALIEEAKLKGTNINGAYVSEKHANFIVNKGNATSKDIKELIKKIRNTIKDKYNIDLELEQEIIKF